MSERASSLEQALRAVWRALPELWGDHVHEGYISVRLTEDDVWAIEQALAEAVALPRDAPMEAGEDEALCTALTGYARCEGDLSSAEALAAATRIRELRAERAAALRRAEAWKSVHSLAVHAIGSPAWQEALKEARALDAEVDKGGGA